MSALPPFCVIKRFTSINFAENQLSLSLIGLSPLASNHPRLLQQTSVRPSKSFYPFFSLFKARSLSFGSNKKNTRTFHTRFCLASTLPFKHSSSYLLADPLCKRYTDLPYREVRLNGHFLFQVLFHSLVKVLFTFPSRYLFTIGLNNIFRQRRWASFYSNNLICFTSIFKNLSKNTGLSPSLVKDPTLFCLIEFLRCLFRFLSPILTESRLISFPKGT